MRDPNRIPAVLDALREQWQKHPDQRLGQLILNAVQREDRCPALYYLEDEALITAFAPQTTNAEARGGSVSDLAGLLHRPVQEPVPVESMNPSARPGLSDQAPSTRSSSALSNAGMTPDEPDTKFRRQLSGSMTRVL